MLFLHLPLLHQANILLALSFALPLLHISTCAFVRILVCTYSFIFFVFLDHSGFNFTP